MKRYLILVVMLLAAIVAGAQVTAVGNLTAATTDCTNGAGCVAMPLPSTGVAVAVQVTGTWAATIQFEGTVDGTNWFAVSATPFISGSAVSSSTANGTWLVNAAGLSQVRVRCSAFTSGTVIASLRAAMGVGYSPSVSTDPCSIYTKIPVAISQTATTKFATAAAGKRNILCTVALVGAAAEIVSIWEGTGSNCGTGTVAVAGSTTTANGMSFAANGGISAVGGSGTVIQGVGTNVDSCVAQNTSSRVAGWITYVQAP